MDTRESIKGLFNTRPITEETSDPITPESIALDKLIGEELDAIRSYRTELETVQAENVRSRFFEIITDEQEHVRELAELANTYDQGVYNKYSTDPEFIEATASADKTVTEDASTNHSFTIQYREDGKVKYSTVTANSGSDALNKFRQITRSQGRNVSAVSLAIQDLEIDEAIGETTNVIAPETNIIDKIALLNSDDQGEVLAKYLEDDVSEQELSKYIRSRMPKINEALEDDPEVADQEISSAETSINSSKIPTLFHLVNFKDGSLNLDYGGGKFDNVADYLESEYGATNLVYDPYNRSSEHNKAVLDQVRKNGGADTVTCSNVLNVIKEPSARLAVIRNCKNYLKNGGTAYFTVYVGDSSGVGKITSKGYQLNQKTPWYVDEISQVFSNVSRKGQLIIAK